MSLAALLDHPQIILLGLGVLVLAWTIHRSRWKQRERHLEPSGRVEMGRTVASERAFLKTLHESESRLYDFGREAEARLQTQIAVLEHLIREANLARERLEAAIDRVANGEPTAPADGEQRRVQEIERLLAAAGHGEADEPTKTPANESPAQEKDDQTQAA